MDIHIYPYNAKLLNNREEHSTERNTHMCNGMNESWKHHVKSKPDRNDYIQYDCISVKS